MPGYSLISLHVPIKVDVHTPRGLHIDQVTNEVLLVERFGGYGIWDNRARLLDLMEVEV